MSSDGKRMTDAERVQVMLSVLPWLAASGGAPLTSAAEHFGVDPEQLRADLMTVFYDVEPEIGADTMVDVHIDEDDDAWVSVTLPGSFAIPPRLSHGEALALLAAGSAFLGERGSELALAPAVEKLTRALGPGAELALDVDLGAGDPDLRRLLRTAVEDRLVVELEYFSWGSDRVATRVVDPWALQSVHGNWYLTGWCHDRDDLRHFRLDRILSATTTDQPITREAPEPLPHPQPGVGEQLRVVHVTLPASHVWLVDSFPTRYFEDNGESVRFGIAVHSETWLDRLLVRLPAEASVTDDSGTDLGSRRRATARRIMVAAGFAPPDGNVNT